MKINVLLMIAVLVGISVFRAEGQTNTLPSSGNVGIGTLSPNTKLHIYQSTADQIGLIVQGNTINTDMADHYIGITLDGDYGGGSGNYSQIRSYSNLYRAWGSKLAFYTSSSHQANALRERMVIDATGSVGIGVGNPKALFDVGRHLDNGQLGTVFGRLVEGDAAGEGTFLGVRGYGTDVINGKSFSLSHGFYGQPNSSINFHRGVSATGGFISFATHSDLERMRIDDSGNVGIGTPTPKEKLSVSGKIRAHEVKVEVANWPDYVFDKNYKSLTIQELEKHIYQHKRLPGFPSAKEAENNGIDLGEINKALLKNQEELTLLLIQQSKEIEMLAEKLKIQEAIINKLK